MPHNRRSASGSVSAPNTPQKRVQKSTTPSTHLLAGTPSTKRKASAPPADTLVSSQKKTKTSNPPRGRPKKEAAVRNKHGQVINEEDYEGQPYKIECPAKPAKKNEKPEEVYRNQDGESLGLSADYAVRPGHWGRMKDYKRAKYNGMDFKIGDFAYFAKNLSPPEDPTDEEVLASYDPLAWERENFYLGMIADVRADNAQEVYLRILYAYWPEELPQGRQTYHGMKEVIMSNHMDIKEAHTIGSKVEVVQVDDSVEHIDAVYWRQTLDITRLASKRKGTKPGVLSKLRTHCECGDPWNPDKPMYICRDWKCDKWHHEACLIDAVLARAWIKSQSEGGFGNRDPEEAEDEAASKTDAEDSIEVATIKKDKSPVTLVKGIVKSMFGGSPAPAVTDTPVDCAFGSDATTVPSSQFDGPLAELRVGTAPSRTKRPRALEVNSDLCEGVYSATIDDTGKYGKEGVVIARVTEDKTGKIVWTVVVNCFGCGKKLE